MGYEIVRADEQHVPGVAAVFALSRKHALPYLPQLHTPEENIIAFTPEWINHLYLLPQAQGRGIGSRLLALAKEQARTLDLWIFQKNLNAQRFYERHGFEVVRMTDGSKNEEREPDVLLRWIASIT